MFCEDYKGKRKGPKWLSHQGQCDLCRTASWATHEVPRIVFGAVPGGTTKASVARAHSEKFHKDMHAYREAVRHGLDPEQVSVEAVEKADKIGHGVMAEHDVVGEHVPEKLRHPEGV